MKNLQLLLLIILPFIGFSQNQWPNNTNNFEEMMNVSVASFDTVNNGTHGYKVYNRTKLFWDNRGYINDADSGSFDHIMEATKNLMKTVSGGTLESYFNCTQNNPYPPNWSFLGPDESVVQDLGTIVSLELDPNDPTNNTLFAGTNASGLWKTTNALSAQPTWVNITDVINVPGLGIQEIIVDPNNSDVIYVATGVSTFKRTYGVGILKTINGGQSWSIVYGNQPGEQEVVYRMIMDPTNSNIVYAAANHKLLRTMDGGLSWPIIDSLSSGVWKNYIKDIEFDLADGTYNTLYFTSNRAGAAPATFFKLLNSKSVTPIRDLTITQPNNGNSTKESFSIAVSLLVPENLYLLDGTLYVSNDRGVSWNHVGYPNTGPSTIPIFAEISFGNYYRAFEVSKRDTNIFYAGTSVMWKANFNSLNTDFIRISDYGNSISALQGNVHADIRAILLTDLGNEDGVFLGTDGGISYSDSSGNQWDNINGEGLQITQFYKLGGAEKYPNLILGGALDNGTKKLDNGGWTSWVSHGDGGECLINGDNPNIYYTTSNSRIISSTGSSFLPLFPSLTGVPSTGQDITFHGNNYNAITYSNYDVYNTQNAGSLSFTQKTFNDKRIGSIAVSPSNPLTQYYSVNKHTKNGPMTGVLFRSDDGGNNWTDITAGFEGAKWQFVTDIEINPDNPNEIWISNGGFWQKWNVNTQQNEKWLHGENRVTHMIYANGAPTYEYVNYSDGLTYFSVNNLELDKGTKILYAATDIGVYYKDVSDPNSTWIRWCDNMPQCIVTDIEINHCANKLRVATFGRGLWEADLIQNHKNLEITSTTTWSSSRALTSHLLIKSGNTLFINNGAVINIAKDKIIKIEKGAKLMVDGATLTNQCGELWGGIEVRGDRFASQLTVGAQGTLIVMNGSLIENAHTAVYTSEHDVNGVTLWNTFGGLVRILNSTFKNNKNGIIWSPYQNFLPNNPSIKIRDLGYVQNSTFTWDDSGNMVDLGIKPIAHIGMWKNHGIRFLNNNFKNDASLATYAHSKRGIGMRTFDTDFSVSNTIFEELKIGIKAMGFLTVVARVNISNNTFNSNRFGVMLESVTFPSVTENRFNVPLSLSPIISNNPQARGLTMQTATVVDAIGIYSTGTYGYNYEENIFNTSSIAATTTLSNYAIVSDYSREGGGFVYRNTYNNIIVDNLASKNNELLKIDCNTHNAGALQRYSMAVTSGELANQGNCGVLPAKNTFSPNCAGEEHLFHYDADPTSVVYSALSFDLPICYTSPEVLNKLCLTGNNTCLTNFGGTGGSLPDPVTLTAKMSIHKAEKLVLTNQFDGGDKEYLLTLIATEDNDVVKSELLVASPYLSDDVLIAFLEKEEPLSAEDIQQIVIENSPVTDKVNGVIATVEIPNEIRTLINEAQEGISERRVLENQIKQLEISIQLLKSEVVRIYLDSNEIMAIETLLKEELTLADKMTLIPLIIEEEPAQAALLITALRADAAEIQLTMPESEKAAEIDLFCDYYTLVKDKIIASGSFNNLTPAEELIIRALAASNSAVAINAQNVLALFRGETTERYAEAIVLNTAGRPGGNTESPNQQPPTSTQQESYQLNNYPNPFNENTIIEVTIPLHTTGKIMITDVTGKQLKHLSLNKGNNQIELNGSELGYGIFFYTLYINDEFIETKKMVRIR